MKLRVRVWREESTGVDRPLLRPFQVITDRLLDYQTYPNQNVQLKLGTCESFFFVRIESAVYHVSVSSCVKYAFTDILQFVVLISVLFNYYFTVFHSYEYETAHTTVVYTLHLQRIFNPSIGILYLWRTRVMYGLRNSELSTCSFQFSHKTRQTMLLYAYFTPKVYFKLKFNHHQSFLYEWRLTARTIRIGPSIRIERTLRNRIESRSFAGP